VDLILDEPENDFPDPIFSSALENAAHNLEAFFMNKAIYDMYQEKYPDDRLFIMRAAGSPAFSGSVRNMVPAT